MEISTTKKKHTEQPANSQTVELKKKKTAIETESEFIFRYTTAYYVNLILKNDIYIVIYVHKCGPAQKLPISCEHSKHIIY